jgi:hypothetical protein
LKCSIKPSFQKKIIWLYQNLHKQNFKKIFLK